MSMNKGLLSQHPLEVGVLWRLNCGCTQSQCGGLYMCTKSYSSFTNSCYICVPNQTQASLIHVLFCPESVNALLLTTIKTLPTTLFGGQSSRGLTDFVVNCYHRLLALLSV